MGISNLKIHTKMTVIITLTILQQIIYKTTAKTVDVMFYIYSVINCINFNL